MVYFKSKKSVYQYGKSMQASTWVEWIWFVKRKEYKQELYSILWYSREKMPFTYSQIFWEYSYSLSCTISKLAK